ncbi:hypothetical protein Nepgr_010362 [Nepenthes gracilis]|uniref:Uncharacterized protein n=1 Tax=Nepenthes gracilis TaxID=150966 RepID=A0AAD3SD95_NEPGR|nr:hypothetical protein Nepgr_010362 [Nepenthes gracilis]
MFQLRGRLKLVKHGLKDINIEIGDVSATFSSARDQMNLRSDMEKQNRRCILSFSGSVSSSVPERLNRRTAFPRVSSVRGVPLLAISYVLLSRFVPYWLHAMLSKVPAPSIVAEFKPMSCCSVIYSIISKIIAHRIKRILDLADNDYRQ